jgi:hypothetical protein
MSREIKIVGYVVASLVAARFVVLLLDAVAESVERQSLYR